VNRDELKGKAKDMMGRAERQAGEWTGKEETQLKGAGKQIEGKGQQALGKLKEAGKDMKRDLERRHDEQSERRDMENRDRKAA
jgi:uncharacterized protein YjbJ (UPF0337 family)